MKHSHTNQWQGVAALVALVVAGASAVGITLAAAMAFTQDDLDPTDYWVLGGAAISAAVVFAYFVRHVRRNNHPR
jgi:hypothetical protein